MKNGHLTDERLVEMSVSDSPSGREQEHLGSCSPCERRRAVVIHLLQETAQASIEEADAAFPAERLARQQLRILQRIEHEGRPARVIAFPLAHTSAAAPRATSRNRWVAAAAAAGVVVGLVAGRYVPERPRSFAAAPAVITERPTATTLRTAVIVSDDELLGQIENAVESRGGSALRPLDELTPRAWDVR